MVRPIPPRSIARRGVPGGLPHLAAGDAGAEAPDLLAEDQRRPFFFTGVSNGKPSFLAYWAIFVESLDLVFGGSRGCDMYF